MEKKQLEILFCFKIGQELEQYKENYVSLMEELKQQEEEKQRQDQEEKEARAQAEQEQKDAAKTAKEQEMTDHYRTIIRVMGVLILVLLIVIVIRAIYNGVRRKKRRTRKKR